MTDFITYFGDWSNQINLYWLPLLLLLFLYWKNQMPCLYGKVWLIYFVDWRNKLQI
jgi:hypothetical protein